MGYRLTIHFSDGSSEEVDEVFETEQDALAELNIWMDSWEAGKETLMLAGRDYCDSDIVDYDIDEV